MSSKAKETDENSAGEDDLVKGIQKLDIKEEEEEDKQQQPPPKSLSQIAEWIKGSKNILVLTGAGVSVAAGIPDFRSPGTGLYDNLQKYDLPYPEAVFDLNFYRHNPQPFCSLAKEIWPGVKYAPTLAHSFVALLAKKGILLRNYSQNIDGLEFLAEIPDDRLVECHGHFRAAACIQCGKSADIETVKDTIVKEGKAPVCSHCSGYVKPDIVFFGESLPARFHKFLRGDIGTADLLLVLGTSLKVAPVSLIPEMVDCRRVLLNRELVGDFDLDKDLFHSGDCDSSVEILCRILGWEEELKKQNAKCAKEETEPS